ncbi:hypothetical protein DWV81_00620 [Escherichia coli]|nr:hypothetical protein DWV81_00620 [Escherichia coli]
MLTISQIINIRIISSNLCLFAIIFVGLFVGYLYSKMALVHLFPPMQDDKYHGRIENHQSGKSLEFHTVPFILPYHSRSFNRS